MLFCLVIVDSGEIAVEGFASFEARAVYLEGFCEALMRVEIGNRFQAVLYEDLDAWVGEVSEGNEAHWYRVKVRRKAREIVSRF